MPSLKKIKIKNKKKNSFFRFLLLHSKNVNSLLLESKKGLKFRKRKKQIFFEHLSTKVSKIFAADRYFKSLNRSGAKKKNERYLLMLVNDGSNKAKIITEINHESVVQKQHIGVDRKKKKVRKKRKTIIKYLT